MLRQPRPGWVLTGRGRPGSGTQSRTRALGIPRRGWPTPGAPRTRGRFPAFLREWGRDERVPPASTSFFDCLCACFFFSRRRGAVTKALQGVTRRYKALHSCYESLRSRYESLHSRYGAVTNLASRYGVGRLKKSLCLTAAFAPVPAILGGSCPLGCSLSAPATGGLSMVSAVLMYAAGSEKEKRAGGPLHWGHYSTPVRILQGRVGITWAEGVVLACDAIPPAPPSNVFGYRGTFLYRGRGLRPFTLLGGRGGAHSDLAALQRGTLPRLPPYSGARTGVNRVVRGERRELRKGLGSWGRGRAPTPRDLQLGTVGVLPLCIERRLYPAFRQCAI